MPKQPLQWKNPLTTIWGFHIHQELPQSEFPKALLIQQACLQFLANHNINVSTSDAIKPGYGPHLNYMWELRVDEDQEAILEKMGLAISYMAINRFGLSAYIHPLMHDRSLPEVACLQEEGRTNQQNILWFSYEVEQNKQFFTNPPLTATGSLVDTRRERLISSSEKTHMLNQLKTTLSHLPFQDPDQAIHFGFHIHMDFTLAQTELALTIFDNFMIFLLQHNLTPTSTRIYGERENGPHLQRGWEVKFETADAAVLKHIGLAIGWLMCNRQELSIFIHPVTWLPGEVDKELHAHENYAMFIGQLPPLDLNFFRDQLL